MTDTMTTYDRVKRAIRAATGEDYGDGFTVTAVIDGYASHPERDAIVVLGNWNDKRFSVKDGEGPITLAERVPSRLANLLESIGAEIEWCDEWTECNGCYKAIRTEPNSYDWQPEYAWVDGCEIYCTACLMDDPEAALVDGDYIDNAAKCVTWADASMLIGLGFQQWEPSDPHTYEAGWHPGQTDDPNAVLAEIQAADDGVQTVFLLDESSQFYVKFSAWTRPTDTDTDNDN